MAPELRLLVVRLRGIFHSHAEYTRLLFAMAGLLPRFHKPLVFTCLLYHTGIALCESASSFVLFR